MKKIALFTALVCLGLAANAQSISVQSAITDVKRGYLSKAKTSIDKACVHEDTKDDPKTWYWAAVIYSQIGDASKNAKSKYKDLDPEWLTKTFDAAMRCKELDKKGEFNEPPLNIKEVFRFVGNEYYNQSIELFNQKEYAEALKISEEAIRIFNTSGDAEYANESLYIAGFSCSQMHDNEGVKKYFGQLVRKSDYPEGFKSKMVRVFNTMYGIYKESNDTVNVMKTANRYSKAMPEDPNASLLLASAYIWTGNFEKGIELAKKAEEKSKNLESYPALLCAIAAIYEQAGDFTTAESKYKESALLQPNQVAANYGMGIMIFNRAADKLNQISVIVNKQDFSDEDQITIEKLTEEGNALLADAIPYLTAVVSYIDGLSAEEQAFNRQSLYNSLRTLNTCYIRLEMYNEATPIKNRISQIESELGTK